MNSIKDFPTTMPPMRRYSEVPQTISNAMGSALGRSDMTRSEKRTTDPSHPQLMANPHHQSTNNYNPPADALDLEPVNALLMLRAGENVNRTSREGQS